MGESAHETFVCLGMCGCVCACARAYGVMCGVGHQRVIGLDAKRKSNQAVKRNRPGRSSGQTEKNDE